MPDDYSLRKLHGGAAFPVIGEGAVLGTGLGGIVQPVNIQVSRYARFHQAIPAERWMFEHNVDPERTPVVVVLNSVLGVITDSVNYSVNERVVEVWTEGVLLTGYVDLFWFGPTGVGGGDSSPPQQEVDVNIDGGTF